MDPGVLRAVPTWAVDPGAQRAVPTWAVDPGVQRAVPTSAFFFLFSFLGRYCIYYT